MPLLVVCFVIFFGLAELFPIVEGLTLPMPVYAVAGFLLAIASNYHKPAGLPWSVPHSPPQPGIPPTVHKAAPHIPAPPETNTPLPPKLKQTSSKKVPELPTFNLQPRPSVSFIVRRPGDYSDGETTTNRNPNAS